MTTTKKKSRVSRKGWGGNTLLGSQVGLGGGKVLAGQENEGPRGGGGR